MRIFTREYLTRDLAPPLVELIDHALFSGSVVDESHPLDAHRLEHRFLLKNTNQQLPALNAWATKNNQYKTRTIYLDTKKGTWTRGRSQVKFRLRHYDEEPEWWIELKTNISGVVDKTRRIVTPDEMDELGLFPVAAVTYLRQEFEAPASSNFRVTVDNNLLCWYIPFSLPLSKIIDIPGQPIARLQRYVLELKQHSAQPQWLNLPERWNGSKSRWSLAALAGHPDTIAPSITNEQLGKLKESIDGMPDYNPTLTPWVSQVSSW